MVTYTAPTRQIRVQIFEDMPRDDDSIFTPCFGFVVYHDKTRSIQPIVIVYGGEHYVKIKIIYRSYFIL